MHEIDVFLFLFPALMSIVWTCGALWQYRSGEHRQPARDRPSRRSLEEPVSILIPCFNEGRQVMDTVSHALAVSQQEFEVIVIDDGSTDDTPRLLEGLAAAHPRLRVVQLGSNQGKASALRAGAMAARFPILVCIDGDARIDQDAPGWLVERFLADPRLGAATGNPRVRNRHSMLTRLQVGEFSTIIGTIKRAQMLLGCLFTVSGVIAAFRKSAVEGVGLWTIDALTEDIDITWKIQRAGWSACFEPRALVWILTPATLSGLWRQRLRWSMGGAQVLIRNVEILIRSPIPGLRLLMLEMIVSVAWCYLLAISVLAAVVSSAVAPMTDGVPPTLASAGTLSLISLFMLQFSVGVMMDHRYDRDAWRSVTLIPLYPAVFWTLQFLTIIIAYPMLLTRRTGKLATWISPDRGER